MPNKEQICNIANQIFQQILAVFVILVIWEVCKVDMSTKHSWHVILSVLGQILAVFIILVLWEACVKEEMNTRHTWHVIMSVLGVALCMAEAVQLFKKGSSVACGDSREERSKLHLIVMCIGFVLITIGISLKISETEDVNAYHFQRAHGLLGLVAWIMAFVTGLIGLLAADIIPISINTTIKKFLHIFLGVITYIIAIVCLGYGVDYLVPTNGQIFLYILLALYVIYSLIGPFQSMWKLIS